MSASASAASPANAFTLTATIVARDALRYTPAGLPLVDCVLAHASEQGEAGQVRRVELESPAIAFEGVALRLANCRLDANYRFEGFFANRSARSKRIVLHITNFE